MGRDSAVDFQGCQVNYHFVRAVFLVREQTHHFKVLAIGVPLDDGACRLAGSGIVNLFSVLEGFEFMRDLRFRQQTVEFVDRFLFLEYHNRPPKDFVRFLRVPELRCCSRPVCRVVRLS